MKDFFDTWKFKILVAVAVFLVGIMAYAGANGRLTAAPQELLGVILTPFQKAGAVVSGGVGAMWEKYASIDKVMEQNEQLTAENAELRQQMVDYDRIKAENEAYKALANIQEKNSNATYVSGFVIGRDPLDEFGGFTLDKGTADGVAVNNAVISDRGYLLGMVVEADPTSCKVMTILHPSFNAAGVVSRTRENGILNGNTTYAPDGLCTLTKLERSTETRAGAPVIATGLGGGGAPGWRVGTPGGGWGGPKRCAGPRWGFRGAPGWGARRERRGVPRNGWPGRAGPSPAGGGDGKIVSWPRLSHDCH